jgi:hypothetical protein
MKKNNIQKSVIDKLKTSAEGFFKNYDAKVDEKIFLLQTGEFYKQLKIETKEPAEI